MIDSTQIQQKSEKIYPYFLASIIIGERFFPKEFPVGSIPKDYLLLRDAMTQLLNKSKQNIGYGYAIELESRKTQKHGLQSLPKRISIDTEQDYLKLIKKEKEVAQFKLNIALIQEKVPELQQWLCCYPLRVIEYRDIWDDLLKVCQYFQQYPKPNLYIRELPIQVHTKFIEKNKGIIRGLLEAILPAERLISVANEKGHIFEKQFSLKYSEPLIRLRFLDSRLKYKYNFPAADISIPLSEFKQLNLDTCRCFITENLMNFLTLPPLESSFTIFGSGYAVQSLKSIQWLKHCPIFYWGDLDVNGFTILSQLRSYFPQTVSIMMDRETFKTFYEFVVTVRRETPEILLYLSPEEQNLYTYLRLHEKRLEQEHISQYYVDQFLQNLPKSKINF